MKESATFAKRKEKKFVVNFKQIQDLKKLIEENKKKFLTDHLSRETKFTFIENTYFDAPSYPSYHQSIKKLSKRFKLRIRAYSQDNKKDNLVFFEIKGKEDGQTLKNRVAFKSSWVDQYLADGIYPVKEFIELNKGKQSEKALETLSQIDYLVRGLGYSPVLKSSYVRYAYKIKDVKTIRITIDDNLAYKPLAKNYPLELPYKESITKDQYIVEVKYKASEKLDEITEILSILGNSAKFSKYCFGVYSAHKNLVPVRESQQLNISPIFEVN